jgi:hypothetical protein
MLPPGYYQPPPNMHQPIQYQFNPQNMYKSQINPNFPPQNPYGVHPYSENFETDFNNNDWN